MEFEDKRILVIGAARSGLAASMALARRGAKVSLYDSKPLSQLGEGLKNLPPAIKCVAGQKNLPVLECFHLVVAGPGVSLESPVMKEVRRYGLPVIGELELAYLLMPAGVEMAAITGTNGKTTTTSLVAEIFKRGGIPSVAAGNIGLPVVSVVEKMKKGIIATEVSSFQLETVHRFHPRVSAIINITPDHLDRHHDINTYAAIKSRVFLNQKPEEYAVLNWNDPWTGVMIPPCRALFFSISSPLETGIWIEEGIVRCRLDGEAEKVCPVSSIKLRGRHNLENVLAAVGLTRACGVPASVIASVLAEFTSVRHRLEEVSRVDGVLYVNDSKGTNPESTIKALESFAEPIVLIAGGRSKGSDFGELALKIKERVRYLVLVGEASSIIKEKMAETGFENFAQARDFREAVLMARQKSEPGDVVLLSPACASWDMFNSYEERGDLFCSIVRSFKGDE